MTDIAIDSTVATARIIATRAHFGQLDKLGAPYIDHPRRMAEQLSDPLEQATAWLHDVVEDTQVSPAALRAAGIPAVVVEAVRLLTRTNAVSDAGYYAAIRRNPIALAVKLADIADNTAPWRVEPLDAETKRRLIGKYARALDALGEEPDPRTVSGPG